MSAMNHVAAWPRRRVRCVLDGSEDALRVSPLIYGRAPGGFNAIGIGDKVT